MGAESTDIPPDSDPQADEQPMKLYSELASWWPLLSPPAEYVQEAAFVYKILCEALTVPPRTLLELGSGGGNNASHLKAHFQMTLVDCSPEMLAVSRGLNSECEHFHGDMRTIRLGRTFDAVFIHDAIMYMTTESDLRRAIETAYLHCRPGGVALFAPDYVKERFAATTEHGGHDGPARSLRYLEWAYDPDHTDCTYIVDYACLLREADGTVQVVHDRHIEGLFSRAEWLRLLGEAGFRAKVMMDPYERELFLGRKPGND